MCHDKLCDAIDLFNISFSIELLMNCLNGVVACLFNIFNVIHIQLHDYSNKRVEFLNNMMALVIASYSLLGVVLAVVCASFMAIEGNKTISLVHKILNLRSFDQIMTNQAQHFSLQFNHRSTKISTGFYLCDWTFFFMVSFVYL